MCTSSGDRCATFIDPSRRFFPRGNSYYRPALVDVYYVRTSQVVGQELLDECRALLTAGERERLLAFRLEANRHEYLITRALCRGVLAQRLGCAPGALTFQNNAFSKPELEPDTGLRFNLANTTAMVVCAVARDRDVGVDTEPFSQSDRILEVAGAVCTPAELKQLAGLDLESKRAYAVRLWTLKEAYMKARGMGMSIPPRSIELDIDLSADRVGFACASDPSPARWSFSVLRIEDHQVTTCVERRPGEDPQVRARQADLRALLLT